MPINDVVSIALPQLRDVGRLQVPAPGEIVSWDQRFFLIRSIARPYVGDASRRTIHHGIAGSRAQVAAVGNRDRMPDARRRAWRRSDGAAYRDDESAA